MRFPISRTARSAGQSEEQRQSRSTSKPPSDALELSVPLSKLLLGLLVTIVPVSLASIYAITKTDESLQRTIGARFSTMADATARSVAQFIHERVTDVGQIALDPNVLDAVAAANRAYDSMTESAISARLSQIDKSWSTTAAEPMVKQMLSSPASHSLLRHRALDPKLLRITVTDSRGAAIAATHKTLDYYQADEDYWQNIYAAGRGAISLTDILYDEATKSNYIGVGVPVLEEGTNRFIGTVDALIDISSLFPVVTELQVGAMGRTLLVKDDGTVISGPRVDLSMNLKSPEFAAVQEEIGTLSGRQTGYVVADLSRSGRHLIGFADTGLKRDYRNLAWIVLVAQDTREAFAPTRMVERLIGFVSVLGLAMLTLLAAYFALHRREPFADIGELRGERAPAADASATTATAGTRSYE